MKGKRVSAVFFALAIAVTALFCGGTAVFAEDMVRYSVDEADVTLKLPGSMDVITRNTPPDSEIIAKHKATPDEYEDYGIFIQGFSRDETQIFTLTTSKDDNSQEVYNYNLLEESQLEEIKENYSNSQYCSSCSMDTYNGIIYFDSIITRTDGDEPVYMTQADTVVNGRYIHFVLESLNGEIDEADKKLMTSILKSAEYNINGGDEPDDSIITFIWIVVIIVAVALIALIIYVLIKKNRRKAALNKINNRLYNGDKKARLEREEQLRIRHTATGADRPDAFFDGIDGLESPQNIDEMERQLIRDAHNRAADYAEKNRNEETDDFFDARSSQEKPEPKRKASGRNKKAKGDSSRKF